MEERNRRIEMNDQQVFAAGRALPEALDRIRRYCGLPWSGGPSETWAWRYYDAVATASNLIGPVDVLCAAALHPGLSRDDLAWFHSCTDDIESWVQAIPIERPLAELNEVQLAHIASLPEALPGPALSLVTKVLHRKRPHAIPLLDRHIIDWYRPITRQRVAAKAWGPLVETMAEEDRQPDNPLATALTKINDELAIANEPRLTLIRARDIAIWMGSR